MRFNSPSEREEFIKSNMKLVHSRVYKFLGGEYDEDMAQEGFIALVLAVDRFNPDSGNSFGTYAISYIDGYILTYNAKNTLIKPNRDKHGRKYNTHKNIRSLSEPVDEASTLTIGDMLASDGNAENEAIGQAYLEHLLRVLTKREKKALLMHVDGMPQREIAKELHVSKTMISRYLLSAKRKIRGEVENKSTIAP